MSFNANPARIDIKKMNSDNHKSIVYLHRASPTRPAPAELPQGGNTARVCGCSGAM